MLIPTGAELLQASNLFHTRYDLAGRLSAVTRNGTAFESYTYDQNDNRLTKTTAAGTTTSIYDNQDRLISSSGTDGVRSWVHDGNGDLVSRTDLSGTSSFNYETTGQLLSVTRQSGLVVSYDLDAGNRRVVKRVNGVVQRKWLYAGGLLPVAEYDASDNLVAVFNGGYMVKNGTTYRLLRDHLGSIRLVVNANTGTVAQRLSYGPYGEVLEDTNPGFQPFGFAGGLYDPDTELVRFGARDYDPSLGRWTCKDPIEFEGGQSNLYSYVDCDPINATDRRGLAGPDSVSNALEQAIASNSVEAIETVLASSESIMTQSQIAIARAAIARLRTKAVDYIAKNCKGSVNREFPGQWKDKTLEQIFQAAQRGDRSAITARKLLTQSQYLK